MKSKSWLRLGWLAATVIWGAMTAGTFRVISTVDVISAVGVVGRVEVGAGVEPGTAVSASKVDGRLTAGPIVATGGGGSVASSEPSCNNPQPTSSQIDAMIKANKLRFFFIIFSLLKVQVVSRSSTSQRS
jgi:hypothetical protein